jgi:L-arabinose isomerase
MLGVEGEDRMARSIHGWFKPSLALPDFLAEYSRHGGTHHLALAYAKDSAALREFADLMGWETTVIE